MKYLILSLVIFFCFRVFSQTPSNNVKIIEKQDDFFYIEVRKYLSNEFKEYFQDCFNDSVKWDCCLVWDYFDPKAKKQLLCPCNLNQSGTLYKQDSVVYTHRKPDFTDFMDWFVYRKDPSANRHRK